jgi:hypothetical protein
MLMQKKTLAACLVLMMAVLASGFQSATEWVKYESAEGRYSVLLPEQPKLMTQEGTTPAGEKVAQYMARVADSNSLYSAAYFDILPGSTYSLDKGRDGMVSAVGGTLLNEQAISLGGFAGRELKVSAKNADIEILIQARLYEIGGRVYVLQHAFQKSSDSPAVTEKTAKFFDSFKVVTGK